MRGRALLQCPAPFLLPFPFRCGCGERSERACCSSFALEYAVPPKGSLLLFLPFSRRAGVRPARREPICLSPSATRVPTMRRGSECVRAPRQVVCVLLRRLNDAIVASVSGVSRRCCARTVIYEGKGPKPMDLQQEKRHRTASDALARRVALDADSLQTPTANPRRHRDDARQLRSPRVRRGRDESGAPREVR